MKYFLDTEFLEGSQTTRQWGLKTDTWLRIFSILLLIPAFIFAAALPFTTFKVIMVLLFLLPGCFLFSLSLPKTPPTIDLISIGIVSEFGQTFYAISKQFNLAEAWHRFDVRDNGDKVYWIRENVLKPIWRQMFLWHYIETLDISEAETKIYERAIAAGEYDFLFKRRLFKRLLNKYGKTNAETARDIVDFIYPQAIFNHPDCKPNQIGETGAQQPEFYAYYADYDWVAFCWLFGKMMDLPKGFPMYCRDLKQMLDDYTTKQYELYKASINAEPNHSLEAHLDYIKGHPEYPAQDNEHHALADAKWNGKLFKFLTRNSDK